MQTTEISCGIRVEEQDGWVAFMGSFVPLKTFHAILGLLMDQRLDKTREHHLVRVTQVSVFDIDNTFCFRLHVQYRRERDGEACVVDPSWLSDLRQLVATCPATGSR